VFPECERVTVYATPHDVLRKTPEELATLREAGLGMVYIGAESGSDAVLEKVSKGATRAEIISSIRRVEEAGIPSSITLISGLAGPEQSEEHAVSSGTLIAEAEPSYASLLTLILAPDSPMCAEQQAGRFRFLSPEEVAAETLVLLEHARVSRPCVFRSNHASNYVPLRGTLPQDREGLMAALRGALESRAFRSDLYRGL